MVDFQQLTWVAIFTSAVQLKSCYTGNIVSKLEANKLENTVIVGCFKRGSYEKKKIALHSLEYKKCEIFWYVSRFEEEMTSKWLHLFEGSSVPYGPINNMKNVFAEHQVCFSKFLLRHD